MPAETGDWGWLVDISADARRGSGGGQESKRQSKSRPSRIDRDHKTLYRDGFTSLSLEWRHSPTDVWGSWTTETPVTRICPQRNN